MKYPYIGKSTRNETVVLFSSEGSGVQLNHESYKRGESWLEGYFENITREYLANTYGEVESREHAEFIVKLAEGAGFEVGVYYQPDNWFCFSENFLFFYTKESKASDNKEKLITIPLPPKEPEPKEPEPKEWPQVGDEVASVDPAGLIGVIMTPEYMGDFCVKYKTGLEIQDKTEFTKPLTSEEKIMLKLEDELRVFFNVTDWESCSNLAKAIINGEINGLSYKPE